MYISRIVIRNFRNFQHLDVSVCPGVTCVVGENNTGKSNLLHALRLAVDGNLSFQYRQLIEYDIHSAVDISNPEQVIVSVEFSNYTAHENECALVGCWEVSEDLARLNYRFRPKESIRDAIESGEAQTGELTLEDYHWELTGGGANDPASVEWNQDLGTAIRFADLQHFQVVFLPALRDVQQDLRQSRISPLARLFAASDIPQSEKDGLVKTLQDANEDIAKSPTIRKTGKAIKSAFCNTAGDAFKMDVHLGMADPSFASIFRSLTVLLSNDALTDFEPQRNGLGLNNVLYISMLLEYFERRIANPKTGGQLLLIEEPEAHLHPQLQRVLHKALSDKQFQTILTTHSAHISSQAPLSSLIVLTNRGTPATASAVPATGAEIDEGQIADLERYLDATRSTLLFARKVILVEGPAELFLIPVLVKQVMKIDLDRLGISVIPIYGTHFDVYAKLFTNLALPKKCAIIADGDLKPSDLGPASEDEDEAPAPPDLSAISNEYVHVFQCSTTFERALTIPGMLPVLINAAEECGAVLAGKKLRNGLKQLKSAADADAKRTILDSLRPTVLKTAKRFGKARFAQVASKHAHLAQFIPKYIREAVEWLVE